MENAHTNSVLVGSYAQSVPDQPTSNDSMAKINENMPASQMANYNGGFAGSRGFGNDQPQHGGIVNSGGEYPPQNVQYNQYNQQNIRPGYPPIPNMGRGGPPAGRGGVGPGIPPNYPPNQQRFMSGASIQQQGGPTPTLNQLLQNANPGQQRYQAPYSDYPMGQQKGIPDPMGANSQNFHQQGPGWNHQQRPMNPYQMQQGGAPYRNQGQMYDGSSRTGPRPPGPAGPAFSQQSSVPGPGPGGQFSSSSQPQQPFSPTSSASNLTPRPPNAAPYMPSASQQPGHPRPAGAPHVPNYNQMPYGPGGQPAMPQQQSFINQPFMAAGSQHSPAGTPTGARDPSPSSQQPPPSSALPRPQPSPSPASTTSSTPQQAQPEQSPLHPLSAPSSQECSVEGDEAASDSGSTTSVGGGGRSRSTPTPTSSAQVSSSHRPVPSPAGSSTGGGGGSRSNTPASLAGSGAGGQGSPMPPRPPSNQLDSGQSSQPNNPRIHSPMSANNQGYGPNQAMMPPPHHMASPGPMPPYGNSSKHMVGPAAMGPQPYPQQYQGPGPHQTPGNMVRGPGPGGFTNQNSGYGGPQQSNQPPPMGFAPPINAPASGMRGPMMPGSYQYNQNMSGGPPYSGYNNQQQAMPAQQQQPPPPQTMPPVVSNSQSIPPLSPARSLSPVGVTGGSVSPGPKGAQAAAQAALIAAASQSSVKSPHRSTSQTPPQTSQQQPMPSHSPRLPQPHMNHMAPAPPPHHNSMPAHPFSQQQQQHSMTPSSLPGADMMGQYNMSGGSMQSAASSLHNNSMGVMNNATSSAANPPHGPPADSPNTASSFNDARSMQANSVNEDSNASSATQSNRGPLSNSSENEVTSPMNGGMQSSTGVDMKPPQPPTPKSSEQNGMDSGKKQKPAQSDVMTKLLDMGDETDRRAFLDRLFGFMDERSTPISVVPAISKQPVDLYKLYHLVRDKGGMVEVTKNKKWRDVGGALNIGSSSSAGFTLRKNYAKYLFAFECRFDLGNVDPAPILASLETPSKKDSKRSSGAVTGGVIQDPYNRSSMQPGGPIPPGSPMPPGGPVQPGAPMQPGSPMPPSNQAFTGFPGQAAPPRKLGPPGGDIQGGPMMPPNVNMMSNATSAGYEGQPPQAGPGMVAGPQQPPQQQQQQPPGMMMGARPPVSGGGLETVRVQDPFADAPPQYPQSANAGTGNMPYPGPNIPAMPPGPNSNYYSGQRPPSAPGDPRMPYVTSEGYTGSQRPPLYQEAGGFRGTTPPLQGDNFNPPSYPPNANRIGPNQYSSQPQMNSDMYEQTPPGVGAPSQSSALPPVGSSPQPTACSSQQEQSGFPSRPYTSLSSSGGIPPTSGRMEECMTSTSVAPPTPSSYGYSYPVGQRAPGPVNMYNRAPAPHPQVPLHQQKPPYAAPASQEYRQDSYSQPQGSNNQPPLTSSVSYAPSSFTAPDEFSSSSSSMSQQQQQPGSWGPRHSYAPHSAQPQQPYFNRMPPPPMPSSLQQRLTSPQQRLPEARPGFHPNTPGRHPSSLRGAGHLASMQPAKKDIVFPPDSVEATMPHLVKRRRLTHKDLKEKVDPWRLLLALRSGLITESTWALDVLSILLYDDQTVVWFALQNLPGLLDVLLGHLRHCLVKMFGSAFEDVELTGNKCRREEQTSDDYSAEYEGAIKQLREAYFNNIEKINSDERQEAQSLARQAIAQAVALEEKRRARRKNKAIKNRLIKCEVKVEVDKSVDGPAIKEEVKEGDEEKEHKDEGQEEKLQSSQQQDSRDEIPKPRLDTAPKNADQDRPPSPVHDECDDDLLDETTTQVLKPQAKQPLLEIPDPAKLDDPANFTYKTRTGKVVKMELASEDHIYMVDGKLWDSSQIKGRGLTSHGDMTAHIMTHFESSDSVQFHREKFFSKKILRAYEEQDKSQCRECMPSLDKDKSGSVCPDDTSDVAPILEPASPLHIKQEPSVPNEPVCNGDVAHDEDIKTECEADDKSDVALCDSGSQETDRCPAVPCSLQGCSSPQLTDEEAMDCNQDIKPVLSPASSSHKVDDDDGMRYLTAVKRKWSSSEDTGEEESEAYQHDPSPLCTITQANEEISRRSICISNILRSLSFIPVNGQHLSKHCGLLLVVGKLLLLHHHHPKRCCGRTQFEQRDAGMDNTEIDSDTIDDGSQEWWWDTLEALRENVLVILANISGHLNLNQFPEHVCFPILDGLLHWAVCPSACARDPLPSVSYHSSLSYHRLVLESLCKLCVTDDNVDLLLATPPFSRLVQLLQDLTDMLADRQEQVMREFAIVLLSSLVSGDSPAARVIALHHPAISLLLDFVEWAEQQAQQIVSAHGRSMLCDNPEMMGTSLDMLRRAASVLRQLAKVAENRPLLLPYTPRILTLLMSHVLDQNINTILAEVLFLCSQHTTT